VKRWLEIAFAGFVGAFLVNALPLIAQVKYYGTTLTLTPGQQVTMPGNVNGLPEFNCSNCSSFGNVQGPGSSVDGDCVSFNGVSGALIQDAGFPCSGPQLPNFTAASGAQVNIIGGDGDVGAGTVTLWGGPAATATGQAANVALRGGTGGAQGGQVLLLGGAGSTTTGGQVVITAGDVTTSGSAGPVLVTAGSATGAGLGNGGNIELVPGSGANGGSDGALRITVKACASASAGDVCTGAAGALFVKP